MKKLLFLVVRFVNTAARVVEYISIIDVYFIFILWSLRDLALLYSDVIDASTPQRPMYYIIQMILK